MSDPYRLIMQRSREWFEQARQSGWLDEVDVRRLDAVEQGTPGDLFHDEHARPLVVALFGGTGVGKSSLLNRLAGVPIARTGVERPTSREVTVYVHASVEMADLPSDLPVDLVRVQRHHADALRDVLWIDAPDIDSTEESNRNAALAWLPHVDLVCYVVSPERYRDDVGWRVLLARGHRHGWMFVLNRWDEGDASQGEDFAHMLREAGFEQPLLLRTCCIPGRELPSEDQFEQISSAIRDLIAAHGVQELARLGHRARLSELRSAVKAARARLGGGDVWEALTRVLCEAWGSATRTLRTGAEWSMQTGAARFAAQRGGILRRVRRELAAARDSESGQPSDVAPSGDDHAITALTETLWDDWADTKLGACLDSVELAARRRGLTAVPVRAGLESVADSAGKIVTRHLRDRVRLGLARPGAALVRAIRHGTGFLMSFLPLMALMWVAWQVVSAYFRASTGNGPLMSGANLAIYSALLVLVAWAVPFAIDRMLKPSLERVVLKALREGLQEGLAELAQNLEAALARQRAQAADLDEQADELLRRIAELLIKPIDARAPAVARLMRRPQPGSRSTRAVGFVRAHGGDRKEPPADGGSG